VIGAYAKATEMAGGTLAGAASYLGSLMSQTCRMYNL